MIYAGVDCGLSGAIAFIHEDGGIGACAYPVPLHDVSGQDEVDPLALEDLFESWNPRAIGVEHVSGFGGAGSAFKLGGTYAMAVGAALWGRYRLERVRPQRWQAALLPGVHGRDALKSASVARAKALYPTVNFSRQGRTKPDDLADALMIATWVRQLVTGKAP